MRKLLSITLSLTLVFSIFAFAGTELSYAASKTPAKVTGLTLKKSDKTQVKVSWKKASGAKKYKVYKTNGIDGWKCIKTTSSKSCYVTQYQEERIYYRVRGINGSKKGPYSSKKSIKLPITNYTDYAVPDYGAIYGQKCVDVDYDTDDGSVWYTYNDSHYILNTVDYASILKDKGFAFDGPSNYQKYQSMYYLTLQNKEYYVMVCFYNKTKQVMINIEEL